MTVQPKTPAQRKALAAKIAKAREQGATGAQLRDQFGEWLTGPERRKLLREFGHDGLIAKSYDRQEAKVKREAAMAGPGRPPSAKRKAKPRKAADKAAASPAQAS